MLRAEVHERALRANPNAKKAEVRVAGWPRDAPNGCNNNEHRGILYIKYLVYSLDMI